jgi:streptomycin 6-kinase
VLDFETSGWLAIDPKGLIGERGFDFANIFTTIIHLSRRSLSRSAILVTILRRCLNVSGTVATGGTGFKVAELAMTELEK